MASQQAYYAYAQNKGTLIPGQTISVNKYTVQVERYLSQGGFAHVYLVRTPTPVYNTTHHVLKRIAVANESKLTEVKKEVDIMRLLKGHPNIVHLIDAAWHKLPNGTYEVFILMEYCPGGGIIDMMNRRLRERLTEQEILQIFVDVCEGVAYMHNSRPSLLHRDLKVENILQSSPTSFKLCDFGSASTVTKAPTNMQEIRALEAELNRHTTLQYRAPEMVDLFMKRPVDEKSDVWALGVLLYKLCFYTTPFEEHGPLAILNVQYRIPPYPLYSQDMITLVGSMLREHGAHRPSVFEILDHVHRLRGTKSQFHYKIPTPQPLALAQQKPPISHSIHTTPSSLPSSSSTPQSYETPADTDVRFQSQSSQARGKASEDITPMRRGRPTASKEAKTPPRILSPKKTSTPLPIVNSDKTTSGPEQDHVFEEARAWKDLKNEARLGLRGVSNATDEPWAVNEEDKPRKFATKPFIGFGDDFGEKLWKSADPNVSTTPNLDRRFQTSPRLDTQMSPSVFMDRPRDKDAFEGLGLMTPSVKPAPTLAEARKLRTGLASPSTMFNGNGEMINKYDGNRLNVTYMRSSSPQSLPTQSRSSTSISPIASGSTSVSPASKFSERSNSTLTAGGAIESRFPSLEELDKTFSPRNLKPTSVSSETHAVKGGKQSERAPQLPPRPNNLGSSTTGIFLKPQSQTLAQAGTRSEQVTGVAMREHKETGRLGSGNDGFGPRSNARVQEDGPSRDVTKTVPVKLSNNSLSTSSLTAKDHTVLNATRQTPEPKRPENFSNSSSTAIQRHSAASRKAASSPPKDWLTGNDEHDGGQPLPSSSSPLVGVPVLRDSPSKRASLIERNEASVQEAAIAQHDHTSMSRPDISPTISRFTRAFPPIDTAEAQKYKAMAGKLTENWSPVAPTIPIPLKDIDKERDSSSADEGPEDLRALESPVLKHSHDVRPRRKGRQSSVHDLVDLWGGGIAPKEAESRKTLEKAVEIEQKPSVKKSHTLNVTSVSTTGVSSSKSRSKSPPRKISPSLSNPIPTPASPFPTNLSPANPKQNLRVEQSSRTPRSRPQSMFIFPSKASEGPASPALVPPTEPNPRASARRTSISDMVQRYEAIGGGHAKVHAPVAQSLSPTITLKPVTTKFTTRRTDSERLDNKAMLTSDDTPSASSLVPPTAFTSDGSNRPTEDHKTVKTLSRPSVVVPPAMVANSRKVSPIEQEFFTPRNLKPSLKTGVIKPIAANKKPIPRDEAVTLTDNGRSPSPERPYQGVGKLIDQWQKKSAEAEGVRNPSANKRSPFSPKRPGVTGNRG